MGRKNRGKKQNRVEEESVSDEERAPTTSESAGPSNLSKKEIRLLAKRRKNGEITRSVFAVVCEPS